MNKYESNIPDITTDKYKTNLVSKDNQKEEDISLEYASNEIRNYISKEYSSLLESSLQNEINRDKLKNVIEEYIEKTGLSIKGINGLIETTEIIIKTLLDFDILTDLLKDPDIEEIRVNSWRDIRIVKKSFEYRTDLKFSSSKQAYNIAQKIARVAGKSLKPDMPAIDTRLENGVRVAIVGSPVALTDINMTIRKQRSNPIRIDDLLKFGSLNKDMLDLLLSALQGGACILFYGGTGSGKTGTMSAIVRELPKDNRTITIADTDEMNLLEINENGKAENSVLMWEIKKGVFSYNDAIKATLRHTPKTIIPQEIRGEETVEVVNAAITDHQTITSLHAKNIKVLADRLLAMYKMSGSDLPADIILKQIANAFELAVRMKEMKDGTKKIVAISEIIGYENDKFITNDIFRYKVDSFENIRIYDNHLNTEIERTKVNGEFVRTGYLSREFIDLLQENCVNMENIKNVICPEDQDLLKR